MSAFGDKLPALRLGKHAWNRVPPNPPDDPELYDGVVWRRAVAYGLDLLLIALLSFCAWGAFVLVGVLSFGLLTPLGAVLLAVLPLAYHSCFLGRRGATPGMRAFDLELRAWTGRPVDYFQGFLTTVLFYTSVSLTGSLILLVALFNDRGRTLHDYLAGTVMVRQSRLRPAAA